MIHIGDTVVVVEHRPFAGWSGKVCGRYGFTLDEARKPPESRFEVAFNLLSVTTADRITYELQYVELIWFRESDLLVIDEEKLEAQSPDRPRKIGGLIQVPGEQPL